MVRLMPIHPDGQAKKNGSLGSSYGVRHYYASDPALGNKSDPLWLMAEPHKAAYEERPGHGDQSQGVGQCDDGGFRVKVSDTPFRSGRGKPPGTGKKFNLQSRILDLKPFHSYH